MQLLKIVYVDPSGSMLTFSIRGENYWMIYTDDCTDWKNVRFFSKKGETAKCFVFFKARTDLFHSKNDNRFIAVQHNHR